MRLELHIPPSPEYSNVITEMGICHSTSELAYIQKPSNQSILDDQVPDNTLYSSVDVMRLIVTPHFLDNENVTIVGIVLLKGRASFIFLDWSIVNWDAKMMFDPLCKKY